MKKSLFILALASVSLMSCGRVSEPGAVNEMRTIAATVKASNSCFHGWISSKGSSYPTGTCSERKGSGKTQILDSSIEADFPSQRLFIHGGLHAADGKLKNWLSTFRVTACNDAADGWTVVSGVNSAGETYELKHREIKEISAAGKAKQSFEGEAILSVQLNGKRHSANLSCVRHVF